MYLSLSLMLYFLCSNGLLQKRQGLSCYEILVFLCFNAMTLKLSVLTNMPQLSCSKLNSSISCKQNSVLNHKTNKDTTKVSELPIQILFLFGFQSLFLCKVTKLWSNNPNKRNVSVSKALFRQKINPVCYPNLSWHFTQYR